MDYLRKNYKKISLLILLLLIVFSILKILLFNHWIKQCISLSNYTHTVICESYKNKGRFPTNIEFIDCVKSLYNERIEEDIFSANVKIVNFDDNLLVVAKRKKIFSSNRKKHLSELTYLDYIVYRGYIILENKNAKHEEYLICSPFDYVNGKKTEIKKSIRNELSRKSKEYEDSLIVSLLDEVNNGSELREIIFTTAQIKFSNECYEIMNVENPEVFISEDILSDYNEIICREYDDVIMRIRLPAFLKEQDTND